MRKREGKGFSSRRRPPSKNWKKLRSSYLALRNRPLLMICAALFVVGIMGFVVLGAAAEAESQVAPSLVTTDDCRDTGEAIFCDAARKLPQNCEIYGQECRKTCGLCNPEVKRGPAVRGQGPPSVGQPDPVAKRVEGADGERAFPPDSALSRAAPDAPGTATRESENHSENIARVPDVLPVDVDPWDPEQYSFSKGQIGSYRGISVTPDVAEQWKEEVETAFKTAWGDYSNHCFGEDELWPVKKRCYNWVGMGLTIIDSMDVLWLMDMKDDFQKCVDWFATKFNPKPNRHISFFETVIRVVGGLLSAYDLSKQKVLLDKARELVDNMLPVFDSPTGLPYGMINPATGAKKALGWAGGNSLLAEIGTIQMEFWYLSNHTGDPQYYEKTHKVIDILDFEHQDSRNLAQGLPLPGQYPNYINPSTLKSKQMHVSWGGLGDSFYEYLLKMWILTGKSDEQYLRMYQASVRGMLDRLWTKDGQYSYVSEYRGGNIAKMDHLACFLGALLALGVKHGAVEGEEAALHMQRAKELAFTCYSMYSTTPSGLAPDHVRFGGGNMRSTDNFYHLRPETVETFFVLFAVTKDEKFRGWGHDILAAINKYARVDGWGYSPVKNVNRADAEPDPNGKMQSFLLAETFKYLWLLMSEEPAVDINRQVFNTEAHPLSVVSTQ